MKKRWLSWLLAVVCLVMCMPIGRVNAAITTATYNTKIEEFVNDARWKNGIS